MGVSRPFDLVQRSQRSSSQKDKVVFRPASARNKTCCYPMRRRERERAASAWGWLLPMLVVSLTTTAGGLDAVEAWSSSSSSSASSLLRERCIRKSLQLVKNPNPTLSTRLSASTELARTDGASPPSNAVNPSSLVAWRALWEAAANAARIADPAMGESETGGHDSFRYEWGTWVNEGRIRYLMEDVMDQIQLGFGAYDRYTSDESDETHRKRSSLRIVPPASSEGSENDGVTGVDIYLHLLPPGCEHQVQYPSGSWSVVKCLTGFCEVAALTKSRSTQAKSRVVKQLRGGTDGSLGSGQALMGDACVKYVGGPMRSYRGKYGKTTLLEVVLRPPILKWRDTPTSVEDDANQDDDGCAPPLNNEELDNLLTLYEEPAVVKQAEDDPKEDGSSAEKATRSPSRGMLGLQFERVGGLDGQLQAIARRVLATRANPGAARRLGIGHVRGILLSGPPGCGKTLLARELSTLLNAREPQIVNGPEILDKYIGEAEKKVRALFLPAEQEYAAAGDDAALHIIILDEMDAIARKRGSMTSDTTGVRDSVVNQLLAKMDGVQSAPNVLVIGLTNRPELLDPALLRPGRLEVQLRVELPDASGRRDILRIHTRKMSSAGGMSTGATQFIESMEDDGLPARTEHYTGAELAGLVRSAASFALSRMMETAETMHTDNATTDGMMTKADLELALQEVRPALGKQDDVLRLRFPMGISRYSSTMDRILRDLDRFTAPAAGTAPRVSSMLLVGGGGGGAGVSALAAYAAHQASVSGRADYVRFVTALDVIVGSEGTSGAGEESRAAALLDKFAEAKELPHSLLVLDDVDQLCAGSGPGRYSSVMLAALRALLRTPPGSDSVVTTRPGTDGASEATHKASVLGGRSIRILAVTSRSDAACNTLHELFEEVVVVPTIKDPLDLERLLASSLQGPLHLDTFAREASHRILSSRGGQVGCKTALRWAERAVVTATSHGDSDGFDGNLHQGRGTAESALQALEGILRDVRSDEAQSDRLCEVFPP